MGISNYFLVRHDIIKQINRYALLHEPKGSFLTAVLSNNLREAVLRADSENFHVLGQIVSYCHNEIPGICWGSPERMLAWFEMPPEEWLDVTTAPETQREMDRQIEVGIWCFENFREEMRKKEVEVNDG